MVRSSLTVSTHYYALLKNALCGVTNASGNGFLRDRLLKLSYVNVERDYHVLQ